MTFNSVTQFLEYQKKLENKDNSSVKIWVCAGPGCIANGSLDLFDSLNRSYAAKIGRADKVSISLDKSKECACGGVDITGCMGPCEHGPVLHIEPYGWYYFNVKISDIDEIIDSVEKAVPLTRLCPKGADNKNIVPPLREAIPFLSKQKKTVLKNMDNMSPLDLDGYIAKGGFSALAKVIETMQPSDVCKEIIDSGLRGRGGGGFPTGIKWDSCRRAKGGRRYVLVNGDEGDPGAFMDRSLMEGDPFSVLEGLIIGAYAVEAKEGIIYVRHEYPLAVVRLKAAIEKLEEANLLGEKILGADFAFRVEICQGGGAFVCGESTALMTSIEGRAGVPRVKYIRSTEKGLWESPTVLNNVETWANVPLIINNGAQWFKSIGTGGSSGTKVFALVGKVKNTGLVEVPMGTTLKEIIYGIGGGVTKDRPFKAVQTGGPSGGCLPKDMLDTAVDFDNLTSAGSMMGSGGMIVMDDRTCMVDVAKYFIDFLVEESCGKCVPCREGLKKMQKLLHDLTSGEGKPGDTEKLQNLARGIADTALCALGQSAANPVLSTIKYFYDEYEEHENKHYCRAGVCNNMYLPLIDEDKCRGCGICSKKCPVGAIQKTPKGKYIIDNKTCVQCGSCIDACPFTAVKTAGRGGSDD